MHEANSGETGRRNSKQIRMTENGNRIYETRYQVLSAAHSSRIAIAV
jgi:hypothetical protein